MALTAAKKKANKKWDQANTKQVKLVLGNAEFDRLESYCAAKEVARTTFIRAAIHEKMEREP